MTLYMDRHELGNATAAELSQAHICDLQVQDRYGVRFITYWYHRRAATGFCLVEAPSRSAAEAAHREAHGNLACEVIEVDWQSVESFLGPIREPMPGQVWEENPVRAIVCTGVESGLGAEASRLARSGLSARGGLQVPSDEGVLGCFSSVSAALEYAIAMQEAFVPLASLYDRLPVRARIAISVGEPVYQRFGLFGAAIEEAAGLCSLASPGETLVSSSVYERSKGGRYVFDDRSDLRLPGIGALVPAYTLRGRADHSGFAGAGPRAGAIDGLSPRELEVLRLIAEGLTNQEIADTLFISLSTVATHIRSIFEKAGVANRAEAAAYAVRHRLIPMAID